MFRLRQTVVVLLGIVLGVASGASTSGAAPRRQILDTQPQMLDGRLMLPAWETTWERQAMLRKDSAGDVNNFRLSQPPLYGVSEAPVQPVRHYAEYEPVDAIYFIWEPGLFNSFFGGLTTEILNRTTVQIFMLHHGDADRALLESAITDLGQDPADVSFVDVSTLGDYYQWQTELPFDRSLESFWMVDFGPSFVQDGDGVLSIIDPRYYTMRVNDDAVPTKIASGLGVNVFRPDLGIEGGNFFSDGRGTCFTTGMALAENAPQTEAELNEILRAYYGCDKTLWLWPLYGEPTGHIDMFLKNASATTLLVGQYDPAMDPDNAALLDLNVQLIEAQTNVDGSPFEILRVPMPDNTDGIWRTYLNGIVVNDLVLVPTYQDHATHEASALAVLGQAFGGRTVVTLDSENIITWGGAIHCVTRTRPVTTHTQMQTPPADECGGDFDCTRGCGEITHAGQCLYGVPAFCDENEIQTHLCSSQERCGWLTAGGYFDCVPPGCGAISPQGECHRPTGWDEVVVTCSADGFPQGRRCAAGSLCVQPTGGDAVCESCTTNECDPSERGCDADGNAWRCGLAVDGDNCLLVVTTECAADALCDDGQCLCTDQCGAGEMGCDPDGVRWSCGEADDGDACTDRVAVPCREEETCAAGVCECSDQCTLGDQGCDEDGYAWFCGEAVDGDTCLDRVVTACGMGTECKDATCVVTLRVDEGCGCSGAGATGWPESPQGPLTLLFGLFWLTWRRRKTGENQ
jgi:agmatine/peptidylarginine deiminase